LVSPKTLAAKDLIKTSRGGAKIVANGDLKKKIRFRNVVVSKGATKAIEASGSKIENTPVVEDNKKSDSAKSKVKKSKKKA